MINYRGDYLEVVSDEQEWAKISPGMVITGFKTCYTSSKIVGLQFFRGNYAADGSVLDQVGMAAHGTVQTNSTNYICEQQNFRPESGSITLMIIYSSSSTIT